VQILDTISRTLARECLLLTVDQPPLWIVGNCYFSTGNDVDHEQHEVKIGKKPGIIIQNANVQSQVVKSKDKTPTS
jgi:hypothetical protein